MSKSEMDQLYKYLDTVSEMYDKTRAATLVPATSTTLETLEMREALIEAKNFFRSERNDIQDYVSCLEHQSANCKIC